MSVLEELNGSIDEYEYQKKQERKRERKRKRNAEIVKVLEDVKVEIEDIDGITEIGAQILDEVLGIIDRKIAEVTNG